MPLSWKDRVKQAVTTGGTGALVIGAASSGFQALTAGDNAKLFAYSIEDGTAWETGYGTYTSSGTSFARTTRVDSSTGAALNVSTSAFLFVDLVSSIAQGMDLAAQAVTPGGRLTLTTAVPVTTSDVTAATNVYYTPYLHNIINLWDGNRWSPVVFAETTLALGTLTNARPYDVFGYLSAGALALESLVWTSDSARATAITIQDGRYCKSGDKTRLYLGTFRTTSTTTTEDSVTKRFLFNHYNRVPLDLFKIDQTNHTYNGGERYYNNDSANKVEWMAGLDHEFNVGVNCAAYAGALNIGSYSGVDLDAATTIDETICNAAFNDTVSYVAVGSTGRSSVAAGYHFLSMLQTNYSGGTAGGWSWQSVVVTYPG